MKNIIISSILLIPLCLSCNKSMTDNQPVPSDKQEIVLNLADDNINLGVETKTTAVTTLPSSLYWGATTGTRGNSAETAKWTAASGTVSSSKISTGKYQTKSATAYNYYVANQTFTVPSTGNVTMSATNTTDVVCGWAAGSSSTSPSVTLNHIFARTGSLTLSLASGYTQSSVSWKIVGKSTINGTAGTYNLSTGAWTAASTKLSSSTAITGSTDLYLIPGTYTVTVTYTRTKGDYTETLTKSGDVILTGGKINNIVATDSTDPSQPIVITVSLTAWSSQTVNTTLS